MFHLNTRHLQNLLSGGTSVAEVRRIKLHVRECRSCARRLEEWRDTHPEMDTRFPELARTFEPGGVFTAGGLVVMPSEADRLPGWLRPRRLLWYTAGTIMLGGVGFAIWMFRPQTEVMTVIMPDSSLPPLRPPDPTGVYGPPPDTTSSGESTPPPVEPLPVSEHFRAITGREAVSRLGGPLRLIQGIDPDHFESGPASAAPGAQSGVSVIRVVYRAPGEDRVHLDQQFIQADTTGFRPIEDPALENGDTVYRTTGTRRSATWLDDSGYLLTISGRLTTPQLQNLLRQVR